MSKDDYYVYILECNDGSYYTGVTISIRERVIMHSAGKASKFTRSRLPVKLRTFAGPMTKSEALKLEYKIKQLPKENKITKINEWSSELWIRKDMAIKKKYKK